MQNTKIRVKIISVFFLILTAIFTGCMPPGPRALLDGKRLIERGNHEAAVDRLQTATALLRTNAQAWNYLGVAYHHTGDFTNAVNAYRRALALNPDLVETRYNLGCLWLENNHPDLAKDELTAFTLRSPQSSEGWLRLGIAQRRVRELTAAERSLGEAYRLDSKNPEIVNEIGLTRAQRNRPQEAAQAFAAALGIQPDYAPAVLNLAVVLHRNLNDPQAALQHYQKYLALTPRPADWESVQAIVQELAQPRVASRPTAPAQAPVQTQPAPPVNHRPQSTSPTVNPTPASDVAKTDSSPTRPPARTIPERTPLPAETEIVSVRPETPFKPARDIAANRTEQSPAQTTAAAPPPTNAARTTVAQAAPQEKRGFWQRINPVNVFRRDPESERQTTPLPSLDSNSREQTDVAVATAPVVRSPRDAAATKAPEPRRYRYRSPEPPAKGDRAASESAFSRGQKASREHQLTEAIAAYRSAITHDPSFFEPYYNLGLALVASGNAPQALPAYEMALAIVPESMDARYSFALALRQSGYPLDAIAELERVLLMHPSDPRSHLALANIYAFDLRRSAEAREHYLKVLENDPQSPQGNAIRQWLVENPR